MVFIGKKDWSKISSSYGEIINTGESGTNIYTKKENKGIIVNCDEEQREWWERAKRSHVGWEISAKSRSIKSFPMLSLVNVYNAGKNLSVQLH